MKVLLLNPPGDQLYIRDYYCSFASKADYYWPPQDLLVLSGILFSEFEVIVLDSIIRRLKEAQVAEFVETKKPEVIIYTTGTATLKSDLELMSKLKKRNKQLFIIASAGIMKFIGQEYLENYPFVDAVLTDFSELDIKEFLNQPGNGKQYRGVMYRHNQEIVKNVEDNSRDFSVPIPRHELFDPHLYRLPIAERMPIAEVITSLGCPYHCAFCTAGAYGYKTRDIEGVIEELKYLSSLGVKEILFQDPTFTINTKRVTTLCHLMQKEGLDFTWSCNADIKSMNEEKIKAMKAAGCHTVSVGIESGSDEILQKYAKMITVEDIREKVRLIREYGVRVLGYFIIGLPGEDRQSILKTIALAKKLDLDFASFTVATPDVGTRLRQEALAKGWIAPDVDVFDSTGFPIIKTENLTPEEVWALRRKAVRSFYFRPAYIWRRLKSLRKWKDVQLAVTNALNLWRKS